MFPIHYGVPTVFHTSLGWWFENNTLGHSLGQPQRIRILNTSGNVPPNNDGTPRLLAYGDRVILQLDNGVFLGRGNGYGELARVQTGALEFFIVPVNRNATGQPLSATGPLNGNTGAMRNANAIYLLSTTGGYLTCTAQKKLMLSHMNALEFNIVLKTAPPAIDLQAAALEIYSGLPPLREPERWRSPVQPLMRVPPFIPMHPPDNIYPGSMPHLPEQLLQIAKKSQVSSSSKKLVCIGGSTLCMPLILAWIVGTLLVITIVTVILAKSSQTE